TLTGRLTSALERSKATSAWVCNSSRALSSVVSALSVTSRGLTAGAEASAAVMPAAAATAMINDRITQRWQACGSVTGGSPPGGDGTDPARIPDGRSRRKRKPPAGCPVGGFEEIRRSPTLALDALPSALDA